ncbi:hypothetical protein INT47_009969 [Mucor saturninus]|uniref:SMP-LTD domain-containing protein n=1 Tax=Mucor saturninus TaxID=64648 RepID=A0A8H7QX87_9FUNG|nr:hypothetical protein INT47_009969 [Mucor saturninus]
MIQIKEIILIYLTGGLTFLPIILAVVYFTSCSVPSTPKEKEKWKNTSSEQGKKGWIQLTKRYKPKGSGESNVAVLMSGIQSYVQGSKRQKEHVYAQLKCGALFIYESDQPNEDCKIIIPVHNYNVSIHPEKHQDHDIYGKSVALRLTPKTEVQDGGKNMEILLEGADASSPYLTSNNELYITCARPVDKEDWYFGLLAATDIMTESPNHVEMMDITHFDASAMQTLISTVQQDAEYREVQWLNAILGRLFLGMYKTVEMREYFEEKISKKIQKIKRPSFLGDISVQSVDIGNSIPFVTQPKLLSLTPEGDLMAEATIHYAGGLRVVIQTDFNWNYSSLMKPIRVPLVLSVSLKKLSGKFLMKVKPPPTNRYWIGFYEIPVMDWEITPIVSDKQIRLSMVTNAIQSKIREFMMENIVLPNMDDFPFCPSGGKGGIFGERVPKPSSPKEPTSPIIPNTNATPTMNFDMLGNKLNQTLPKVIISNHQDSFDILQQALPKPPTRRAESLGVLDSSMLADPPIIDRRSKSTSDSPQLSAAATSSIFRSRGYSNPDRIVRSDQNEDESKPLQDERESKVEETVVATPSFSRRISSNIGFRRKQQPLQQQVEEEEKEIEAVADDEELVCEAPPDMSNEVLVTTTVSKECMTIETTQELSLTEETSQYTSREEDDVTSISGSIKSHSTSNRIHILSKLTNNSISNKINSSTSSIRMSSKKAALYNMAGSIFSKKNTNKVTKEMRDERSRELQESHNRKMMSLFINNEPPPPPQQQQQQQQVPPPPLPPRRSIPANSLSSLSSDEEEEEELLDPIRSSFKPTEEVVIVNQQHGLTL